MERPYIYIWENSTSWPWPTFWRPINFFFISLNRSELAQNCVGDICRFWHLSSIDEIAEIALRDLDLLLKCLGKSAIFSLLSWACQFLCLSVCVYLSICYSHWRRSHLSEIKHVKNGICRFWHLPSNGVNAKIVLRDLYLLSECQGFQMRPSNSNQSGATRASEDSNRGLPTVVWRATVQVRRVWGNKIRIETFPQLYDEQPFRCGMYEYRFESTRYQSAELSFLSKVPTITKLFLQICLNLSI